MKLDKDIREMSFAERGKELMRLRKLIRTHKRKKDNARCWLNDLELYDRALPEGGSRAGMMTLPAEILLRNCKRYIHRQQCLVRGGWKKSKVKAGEIPATEGK